MNNRTVLISGGGIAGTTLAYWLARRGFAPTVVERAADLRSSGSPVDVRGPALDVVEQMGIMPRLRDAATSATRLTFVNGNGRRVGGFNMGALGQDAGRGVELPRADLASILYEAGRADAEYVFDDSIRALDQEDRGVDVTFERAAPRRFDLVVGADGLHSRVRRLVFGAERDHIRYLGLYVATLPMDAPADNKREILAYNIPGRAVFLHPARGKALAAFMFRRPEVAGFDYRDIQQHKRLLTAAFEGGSWRVPELLHRVRAADDLYLDAVSRVALPNWSTGRVTLLGDAASCVSLFGEGSSLAIAGAATLADALVTSPDDHHTALTRYETDHRNLVTPKQRTMAAASRLLVPATTLGILTRNTATYLSPIAAAIQGAASKTTHHRAAI